MSLQFKPTQNPDELTVHRSDGVKIAAISWYSEREPSIAVFATAFSSQMASCGSLTLSEMDEVVARLRVEAAKR